MDRKLQDTYTDQILLNEKKQPVQVAKKSAVVSPKIDADFIQKDVKVTAGFKKNGPEVVKGLHKPKAQAGKDDEKPKKLNKESFFSGSKFDSIFKRVLTEDGELAAQPNVHEEEEDEDGSDEEGAPKVASESTEESGDIVADLQDIVGKLSEIVQALGGSVEGEEHEDELSNEFGGSESEVNADIDGIEGAGSVSPVGDDGGVKESLADLKGALSGLKSKIGLLTGKTNKVSGAIKGDRGGKAQVGDSVPLKPVEKSDLHAKNSYKVDSKLKVGSNLFEKRR
jgi:hypothetical protein